VPRRLRPIDEPERPLDRQQSTQDGLQRLPFIAPMLPFPLGMLAQMIELNSNLGEPLLDRGCNRWTAFVAVLAPERAATTSPLPIAHSSNSSDLSDNSIVIKATDVEVAQLKAAEVSSKTSTTSSFFKRNRVAMHLRKATASSSTAALRAAIRGRARWHDAISLAAHGRQQRSGPGRSRAQPINVNVVMPGSWGWRSGS